MILMLLGCWVVPVEDDVVLEGDDAPHEEEDTDTDTGTATGCDVDISEIQPADGQTNWYYRGLVQARLSGPDETAVLEVQGVPGTSWLHENGHIAYFAPDPPLQPNTSYTADLQYCRGQTTWDFSTSDLGKPTVGPLGERVYLWDTSNGNIIRPEGVGALLEQYLEMVVLVGVVEQDEGFSLEIAIADEEAVQDPCNATVSLSTDFGDDPYFEVGPISINDTLFDLRLTGTFSEDFDRIAGITATGIADTRPFNHLMDEEAEDDSVCEALSGMGVSCVDCPLDGQPLCLEFEIIDGYANEFDATVTPTDTCLEECKQGGVCAESEVCACGGSAPAGALAVALSMMAALRRR